MEPIKNEPMKTLKLNDHEIKCYQRKGKSNYELSVSVFKDGILKSGGLMKTKSTNEQIKKFAEDLIEIAKRPFSFEDLK